MGSPAADACSAAAAGSCLPLLWLLGAVPDPCCFRICAACTWLYPYLARSLLAVQDFVQLDAAVVLGSTVLVGVFKNVVGLEAVGDIVVKTLEIRWGRQRCLQAIKRSGGLA